MSDRRASARMLVQTSQKAKDKVDKEEEEEAKEEKVNHSKSS